MFLVFQVAFTSVLPASYWLQVEFDEEWVDLGEEGNEGESEEQEKKANGEEDPFLPALESRQLTDMFGTIQLSKVPQPWQEPFLPELDPPPEV